MTPLPPLFCAVPAVPIYVPGRSRSGWEGAGCAPEQGRPVLPAAVDSNRPRALCAGKGRCNAPKAACLPRRGSGFTHLCADGWARTCCCSWAVKSEVTSLRQLAGSCRPAGRLRKTGRPRGSCRRARPGGELNPLALSGCTPAGEDGRG